MKVNRGAISGDVEYFQNDDGSWSFKLTLEDDPVPIESTWNLATRELAEEEVNYALESASLRKAEG